MMQAAVSDLFEAGFDGLELLLSPMPAFPVTEPAPMHPPIVHGQRLTELSRNLGSMNMRANGPAAMSMDPTPAPNAFQHQRCFYNRTDFSPLLLPTCLAHPHNHRT